MFFHIEISDQFIRFGRVEVIYSFAQFSFMLLFDVGLIAVELEGIFHWLLNGGVHVEIVVVTAAFAGNAFVQQRRFDGRELFIGAVMVASLQFHVLRLVKFKFLLKLFDFQILFHHLLVIRQFKVSYCVEGNERLLGNTRFDVR